MDFFNGGDSSNNNNNNNINGIFGYTLQKYHTLCGEILYALFLICIYVMWYNNYNE